MTSPQMIDISIPFDASTPEWPGDTPFHCGWAWDMSTGASVNVSKWSLSPHVGTHADAPLHVRANGAGADALPVAPFLGDALVLDVSEESHVHGAADARAPLTLASLERAGWVVGTTRLLLRTGRSTATGTFPQWWPTLDPATARALVREGLTLLGVDAPSVDDRESKTLAVHHALFDGGAFVLENLDLRAVTPGPWELVSLPLRVGVCDAAPARAFLRPRR